MPGLLRRFRFDAFLEDGGAALACAECEAFAQGFPEDCANPLVLYGPAGMGKTHLLHAVGNAVLERLPDADARLLAPGGEVAPAPGPVLALADDLSPRHLGWLAEARRSLPGARWAIAAAGDPRAWPEAPRALRTWFEGGRTADLAPPARELLEALLAGRLAAWGSEAELGPGVRAFLLERFGGSPGRFLAALDRLWAQRLLTGERAAVAELAAFLREEGGKPAGSG